MSPENMRAMSQRWQAEAKENHDNLSQFTKWLIANKYVTDYQAGLLAKGHAEDFFLNQYMILERLGRGRMAGVYKAAHPLGQVVAIKVLPPSKAKNPLTFGRFQREAELSIKLRHANVVRTFQVGQAGELHYLVMEFLEGETLDEVMLRRKRLPPAEAVRLIHQALMGLQHIHEQGMVHRDLKPANLMLTPGQGEPDTTLKSTVKILDIGLARQLFEEGQTPTDGKGELTAEGVLLGTPDYLAPEQARDPRTIDLRADIYSLGCVLYHTLTGQPPFPDNNILNQLVRHATEAAKPLTDFNPQIPDGLQQIVNWMMAKKPEERYPNPERAAQALQMFLLADNVPAQPIDNAPQMRKYLTWLEANKSEAATVALPTAPKPASNPPAAAKPAAAAPALAKAMPNPGVPAKPKTDPNMPAAAAALVPETYRPPRRKDKKHNRHKQVPIGAPANAAPRAVAVPLPAAPQQIDVELVAATPGADPMAVPFWPFSKRDWMVLGIGAAAMLVLGVIILVIVNLAS